MVDEPAELEALQREAAELRAFVRELSRQLVALTAVLPLDAVLALGEGGNACPETPLRIPDWHETIELTRADVESEMALLWKRLKPREPA